MYKAAFLLNQVGEIVFLYDKFLDIIKDDSKSIKKWIEFSSKAHVNESIERAAIIYEEKPKPSRKEDTSSDSEQQQPPPKNHRKNAPARNDQDDSDEELPKKVRGKKQNIESDDDEDPRVVQNKNNKKKKLAQDRFDDDEDDDEEEDWSDRPSRKPFNKNGNRVSPVKERPDRNNQKKKQKQPKYKKSIKQKKPPQQQQQQQQQYQEEKRSKNKGQISQKDLIMFELFIEKVLSKIMLSFRKLKSEQAKNQIFSKLNDCFDSTKRKSFDSQILRGFYKKIRSTINQQLS